jgi:hypothetical protein
LKVGGDGERNGRKSIFLDGNALITHRVIA